MLEVSQARLAVHLYRSKDNQLLDSTIVVSKKGGTQQRVFNIVIAFSVVLVILILILASFTMCKSSLNNDGVTVLTNNEELKRFDDEGTFDLNK